MGRWIWSGKGNMQFFAGKRIKKILKLVKMEKIAAGRHAARHGPSKTFLVIFNIGPDLIC